MTAIHDRALEGARAALGETYAAHFAQGREQSAEDAVASLTQRAGGNPGFLHALKADKGRQRDVRRTSAGRDLLFVW